MIVPWLIILRPVRVVRRGLLRAERGVIVPAGEGALEGPHLVAPTFPGVQEPVYLRLLLRREHERRGGGGGGRRWNVGNCGPTGGTGPTPSRWARAGPQASSRPVATKTLYPLPAANRRRIGSLPVVNP